MGGGREGRGEEGETEGREPGLKSRRTEGQANIVVIGTDPCSSCRT